MPWSAGVYTRTNGTYTGSLVWTSDKAANIDILADRHDTHDQDLGTGINSTLHKGGQNSPTANINWGGYKITGLGNGVAATDAANVGQTVTALSYTANSRTITAVRSVGNLTAVLPVFTAADAGLVPAPVTQTGRALIDTGQYVSLPESAGLMPTLRVTTSGPVLAGFRYEVGADSITLTLPAAPANGDTIFFVPASSAYVSWIVARNGKTIMSFAEDMTGDGEGISFGLVFSSATNDWKII